MGTELGVHERRLERISERLAERSITALNASRDRREALRRFRELWEDGSGNVWPVLS